MAREIPIKISVDGREAQRGINRVDSSMESLKRQTDRTDKSTTSLRRNMDRLGRAGKGVASSLVSLKGAIGALGLLGAAEGFRRLTTSVVAAGNSIDKAAQTAGTTTAQLQELRFALGQLGDVTNTQVDSAFRRFSRRLGDARNDMGALNDRLSDLNITAGEETPEALESALETLGNVEDSSRRASLAAKAFGEEAGPALAGALSQGTEALREQRQVAQELGLVLTEDGIETAAKLQDEFTLLGQIIQRNFQAGFLENFQGEFDTFRAAISDEQFIQSIRDFGDFASDGLEFIINNSDDIASGFRETASAIESLATGINDLVELAGPLKTVNDLLLQLSGITALSELASGNIPGVSSGGGSTNDLGELAVDVTASKEALEETVGTVRTLSEEFELLSESIPNLEVKQVGEDLEEALQDRLEELDIQREAQRVGERIGDSLSDALISGDFEGVGDAIGAAIGSSVGESVAENVTSSLSESLGSTAGGIAGGAAGGVVGGLAGQIAADLVGDVFGSDFVDPTARRQAEQGTGTVLGSIDAKSESISNSVEEISEASNEIVNINSGMLRSLEQVQNGIQQAAARVAQGRGDVNFQAPDTLSNSQQATRGLLPALGITEALPGGAALFNTLGIGTDFVDDIVGGLVGTIDDVLGGALSSVGNALFGGDSKVVDDGIQIVGGAINELIDDTLVKAFATIKTDGGFFGSSDKDEKFQELGEATSQQFEAVFRDITESVEQGAEAIGLLPGRIQDRIDDFVVETQRISLEDLNANEKAKEINSVFSSIFDDLTTDVVPFLEDFQRAGEGLGETLARVGTQVGVLKETFLTLGKDIDNTFSEFTATVLGRFVRNASNTSAERRAEAATDLSQRLGGTEEFARAISGLEENFFSASEQFEANQRRLNDALGDLPLPETREGFLELARSQDLSTEAGRENLATILRVRDSADEFFDTLEDRQKEQTDALKQGTEDALSALRESVNAELDAIRERRQSLQDELSDATGETDAILGDIRSITQVRREESQQQLADEREAIQARADARRESIDESISAEQDRLQRFESLFDAASSALDNLMPEIVDDSVSFERAMGRVRDALRTGGIGAADDLQRISEVDVSRFGSRFEFERTQGRAAATLSDAQERAGGQVSQAEQQIQALENQKQAVERTADRQIQKAEQNHQQTLTRLDGILEDAKKQIDEARDTRDEITNIDVALDKLSKSIDQENAIRREIERANFEKRTEDLNQILSNANEQLNELRGINNSVLGVQEALGNFESSLNNERQRSKEDQEKKASSPDFGNIGAFASGGTHTGGLRLVGEQGPEIEATGPSRIMNNTDLMQSLGASKEMLAELKALRQEMRANGAKQIEIDNKIFKLQRKHDIDGIPETRT